MRLVRWSGNERADVPDVSAMSTFVLGEFRRTLREVVLGGDVSKVLRGFAVEPESPASSRVVVRLNNTPSAKLSAAFGAENLGGVVAFGQLIGGDADGDVLEGAAQQLLDFAGQPVATYRVQLRFTYADGGADNRAFWNDTANAEFLAATDTRVLPLWELRFSGAPSSEWIDLADVAWGGGTVVAGNITDVRDLAFEGSAPFQQTTQAGSGGIPDFDRTATRGGLGVGSDSLLHVVNALQRQIRDLKGQNDAGTWDWFSRPFSTYDPDGALPATSSKTLRSVDTVTCTVGDGVSTFGDFNGVSGVQDAIDHIFGMTTRPERAEIVVHGGLAGGYVISTGRTITNAAPFTLIIRAGETRSTTNVGSEGRPRITIDGDSVSAYALILNGGGLGHLVLRDLDVSWTGATASKGGFFVNGALHVDNCRISQGTPDVGAEYILGSALAGRSRITRSTIVGRVNLYDVGSAPGVSASSQTEGGIIANCNFSQAHLTLRQDGSPADQNVAVGFTIVSSAFSGRTGAIYTGSVSMIEAASSKYLTLLDCDLYYGVNENGLDARTYGGGEPFRLLVRGCRFESDSTNGAIHAVDAGSGASNGTGWGINVQSTSGVTFSHEIVDCRFVPRQQRDAGGIRLRHVRGVAVRGCEFTNGTDAGGGSDRNQAILVTALSAGHRASVKIEGCWIHQWGTSTKGRGVRCSNVDDVQIRGCTFRGDEQDGTNITGRGTEDVAVYLTDTARVTIADCDFADWEPATAANRTIVATAGANDDLIVHHNRFTECGGYSIHYAWVLGGVGLGPSVIGNQWRCASSNEYGCRIDHASGFWVFNDNRGQFNAVVDFLYVGTTLTARAVAMGNVGDGTIRVAGGSANLRGYNEAGQDLNSVSSYT